MTCQNLGCRKEFTKRLAKFNRSERLGKQHFCSKICYGKFKDLINFRNKIHTDTSYLREIIIKVQFSPFRYHLKVLFFLTHLSVDIFSMH